MQQDSTVVPFELAVVEEKDFSSKKLFLIAKAIHPLFERYREVVLPINEKSSHRKNPFRMNEQVLRAVPGQKLKFDLCINKSISAVQKEKEIVALSSTENGDFNDACQGIIKFFKKEQRKHVANSTIDSFEGVLITYLLDLWTNFFNTLNNPESFHEFKIDWSEKINVLIEAFPNSQQKNVAENSVKKKSSKPRELVEVGDESADGWIEEVSS